MCSLLLVRRSAVARLRASYGAGEAYLKKPRLNIRTACWDRGPPSQADSEIQTSRAAASRIARAEDSFALSVPLFSGQAIGVLSVADHPYIFQRVRTLTAFAELSALAIESAPLQACRGRRGATSPNKKLSAIGLLAAEVAHKSESAH
jgi:hypothetical protein